MRKLIAIIVFIFSVTNAVAQYSFSGNATGTINVSAIQSLSVTGGSTIPSFTSLDDYFNGETMSNYVSVTVKSNVSWLVTVQSQSDYFNPLSSGASTNMPASVLGIKTSSSGSFTSISSTAMNLKTGNKTGNSLTGSSFSIDTKFNPGYNFRGGIYSISLLYTLSPQ